MQNKLLLTYSLLAHLKEDSQQNSVSDIFVPIVKKALSEYSRSRGLDEIKGKSFVEIQTEIKNIFGLDIPIPILGSILRKAAKDANSEGFQIFSDNSFIVKSFHFDDIDSVLTQGGLDIEELKKDFNSYCSEAKEKPAFSELVEFISSQNIELYTDRVWDADGLNDIIPHYIDSRRNNERLFGIISDIYLGSLLASYISFKVTKTVGNAELLIDTNFFISLIDLDTEDSYKTCNQLFNLAKRLGYNFKILYTTVDEVKNLLNNRIQDFANKEYIGSIRTSDVFSACIRHNYTRTDLERIKDNVSRKIEKLGISVVKQAQLRDVLPKVEKSGQYKGYLIKRDSQAAAFNDALAEIYVSEHRGSRVSEFADVKCWFLHNSSSQLSNNQPSSIQNRISISADDLLVLLWLANPSQESEMTKLTLTNNVLSSYITRYRRHKAPQYKTLLMVKEKAGHLILSGDIEEKDLFNLCIRMQEGEISDSQAQEIIKGKDEEIAAKFKELSLKAEDTSKQIDDLSSKLVDAQKRIEELNRRLDKSSQKIEDEKQLRKEIDNENVELKKQIAHQKLIKWKTEKIVIWALILIASVILGLMIFLWQNRSWNFMAKLVTFVDDLGNSSASGLGKWLLGLPILIFLYSGGMIIEALDVDEYDEKCLRLFWKSKSIR